ncbi:TetR/AcrR family transcriptional regulator [Desulfitobacterium sp.]|uniref:TetR/AcrR family transcriptional regulator n=1 Tax=Desulfitobacterium sp. TaxID=49981 RepID=UPI002B1EC25F|nr:TetR/AcrR family transcriptional regulator [Desulfitobacterium sp.]MEA4900920.1 TetR/AcrR family transcriptional regulator [Desulfitobacterium sp.]
MPKIIENLKETIILESRNLLSQKGYNDFNVREIAKKCNIALGTFYNYFPTKDEVVMEIVREDWWEISNLVDQLMTTDEPFKEKIRKIYLSLRQFISSYILIFIEMAAIKKPSNRISCDHESPDKFYLLYNKLSELIDIERTKGHINSSLSSYKLAQFIMSNLIYLNRNEYITFDELYNHLKI